MSEEQVAEGERFEALDGLRGVAAAMVLLLHVESEGFASHVMRHGDLGVDLFFVLSGFVIGHAYEKRLRGGMGLGVFLRARMVRLYPLMALGTVLVFGAVVAGLRSVTGDPGLLLVLQLLWIPLVRGSPILFPLNSVHWSLAFELLANLLHAGTWKWLTTRVLLAALVPITVALVFTARHFGTLGVGWGEANLWGGVPRVLFSYGVGLLLYRLHSAGRLPRLPLPWPVLFAAPLAAVLLVDHAPAVLHWGRRDFVIVAGVFPIVVWAAVQARLPASVARVCVFAGLISYPVYALQLAMFAVNDAVLGRLALQGPALYLEWAAAVACLLVAAWLALKFFDEPLRAWLNRRLAPAPQPVPVP